MSFWTSIVTSINLMISPVGSFLDRHQLNQHPNDKKQISIDPLKSDSATDNLPSKESPLESLQKSNESAKSTSNPQQKVNSCKTDCPLKEKKKTVQDARKEFIEKYYPKAVEITKDTGVLPGLLMSQMILESAKVTKDGSFPGESELSKNYNNFFGIKADSSWKGKTVTMPTAEYENGKKIIVNAEWRVYESPEDSMKDHVDFLLKNKRYEKAGVFDAKSVEDQAIAIQKAGYATDPNYSNLVNGISKTIDKTIYPKNPNAI